jgi:hypothetical protein
MELRSICLSLHQKAISAIDIHMDIEAILRPDAIGQSMVTKYMRETQVTNDSEPTPTEIEDECQRPFDKAILPALAQECFASFRRIAAKALVPRTTVYRHLVGTLGMTARQLRYVPHRLSRQ